MCGIAGVVSRTSGIPPLDSGQAKDAIASIRHRGPDSQGEYFDGNLWMGHARLSILDLSSAGTQPMATTDGRFVICYNGEVYNFRELVHSLGLTDLRSHSDTEVILNAFVKLGVSAIPQFNGMFAFVIYDKLQQKVWLVRDRLGIKPLYYRLDSQGLYFASEIKAILAMQPDKPLCDLSSLHEWLFYGNSLGGRTLYHGIQQLLPGHYLELDVTTFAYRIEEYWSLKRQATRLLAFEATNNELISETSRLLEQAVKRQLVSDVPVGIFLSGGIDSSAITAFASRHYNGHIATYTVGFDFDKGVNELPQARRIAALYGTDHHEIKVSGLEVPDLIEKMVYHHDMPFSDAANIPLYLLASKISNQTKVVLQGDGGDEIFGGYRRYVTLNYLKLFKPLAMVGQYINRLSPRTAYYYRVQRYLHALAAKDLATTMALLQTMEDAKSHPAAMFVSVIQQKIEQYDPFVRYRQCQKYFGEQDIVNQMMLIDTMVDLPDIYLQKVDRSTMAASMEVRVPFLDHELVDYCVTVPGYRKMPWGKKKWLLKQALKGIVPDDVLYGPKTGFGVPINFWLRKMLKPFFFDHLAKFNRKHPGILNTEIICCWYAEHETGKRDRSFLLWKILNFFVWMNNSNTELKA